jgi:transposase
VIKWEIRVLLAHYLDQGLSKAAIARQLGMNRRTVSRWIAAGHLNREMDTGQVPKPVRRTGPSKLEPFKSIVEARLATYPELSATRLFDEVRRAGYTWGWLRRPTMQQ